MENRFNMKDLLIILALGCLFFVGCNLEKIFQSERSKLQETYPDCQITLCTIGAATPEMRLAALDYPEASYFILITKDVEIYETLVEEGRVVAINLISYNELYKIQQKCHY